MARLKAATPIRRERSSEYISKADRSLVSQETRSNGHAIVPDIPSSSKKDAGVLQLGICIGGIYLSFITWAYLQEKVLTTPYPLPSTLLHPNFTGSTTERFNFPVFLLTIQSLFSSLTGLLYLFISTPRGQKPPPIIPTPSILLPLGLVAVCQALAAPIGYAALGHVNYITYTLAKSCKLLPVMFLHVTIFRRRYPLHKYLVVAAVTAGVAVFTLHSGSGKKKSSHGSSSGGDQNALWGLLLLSINLLFDGLLNSTQDYIVSTFAPYKGPQMMCANNMMATLLSGSYLILSPWLAHTGVGQWFGVDAIGKGGGGELSEALGFMARHPGVWGDVIGFAACGAVGQVFIFYTIANFGSVILVTVTVTRKMFTMMLSVVAFGHQLTGMQWLGVSLVFGGIGVEAEIKRRSEVEKQQKKLMVKAEKAQ